MTVTAFAAIVPGATLGATLATLYTVPGTTSVKIDAAVFTNISGGTVTYSVSLTPAGLTSRVLIPTRSIVAGGTDLAPELAKQVLLAGGVIQAIASAAGSINVVVSGFTST